MAHLVTDTTAAALQHSSDAAALAKLYGDAATKIRAVAAAYSTSVRVARSMCWASSSRVA
jgi:hypothetical protein